jgi:hypothetical protein
MERRDGSIVMTVCVAILAGACGATTRDTTAPVTSAPASSADGLPRTVELPGEPGVIAPGQEIDVRLQTGLNSGTAKPEQRFEATTIADVTQRGEVLIPAGAVVEGVVASAEPAGRVDRTGRLTLTFDRLRVDGRSYPIRAMASQVYESGGLREDAPAAGAGGAVGGVIGGLIGGVRGAIVGAVIGAGGAIAATEGHDVELPPGSIIRIRFDSTVNLGV